LKVRQLPVHVDEFLFQSPPHRSAWLQPTLAQFQEFPDFFERKSQALYLAYKSQRLHIGIRKLAKTAGASRRARQ
jgi:hypothetical protein